MQLGNISQKVVSDKRVLSGNKVARGVIAGIPDDEDFDKLRLFKEKM